MRVAHRIRIEIAQIPGMYWTGGRPSVRMMIRIPMAARTHQVGIGQISSLVDVNAVPRVGLQAGNIRDHQNPARLLREGNYSTHIVVRGERGCGF